MIYVVQASIGGPIKIGHTCGERVDGRLASLQISCPWPLLVVRTMPGTTKDEHELHRRFAAQRLHGEWFEPVGPVLDWLTAERVEIRRIVEPSSLPLVGPMPVRYELVMVVLEADGGWLRPAQIASQVGRSIASVSAALRAIHSKYGRVVKRHMAVDGRAGTEYRALPSVPSMFHREGQSGDLQGVVS